MSEMENTSSRGTALTKFVLCSIIGLLLFFVNFNLGGKETTVLIFTINSFKKALGPANLRIIVMLCCFTVLICSILAKVNKDKDVAWLSQHKGDGPFNYFTYITSAIFCAMIVFDVGPAFIVDKKVGLSSISVASDVIVAIVVAGTMVVFLIEFGFLEFLGKLVEPFMRTVFLLPGKAAVDAMSSFASSPAVDVLIATTLYKKGYYTEKEVSAIATNFTICSIGAFAFLSEIAGCGEYFAEVVISALLISFVMPIITIRIPPLSRKRDIYYDGTVQTDEERKPEKYHSDTFSQAVDIAVEKSSTTSLAIFWTTFVNSLKIAIKISTFVVSLSVICLAIAHYTPFVKYIGMPVVPILEFLQIPDAETIAPATLVGIFALSLPATLLKGTGVAAMAAFYIVVLSTAQVVFFTESANAILDSEIPLGFWELIIVFIVRTIILIPLVAIPTHIIFG